MKKSVFLFLLTTFLVGFSSKLIALNSTTLSNESEPQTSKTNNIVVRGGRDITSVDIYTHDQIENRFKKISSVVFGKVSEQNIRTDSVTKYRPDEGVEYIEKVEIRGVSRQNDTLIIRSNNEGGSTNMAIKEQTTMHYNDNDQLTYRYFERLGFTNLEPVYGEQWNYDEFGVQTSYIKEDYFPATGEVYNITGDSVLIEINISNNVEQKTFFTFDMNIADWKPYERWDYTWENDMLNSVTIGQLNDDGSLKIKSFKIENITDTVPITINHDWNFAISYDKNIWQDEQWKPYERVENEFKTDGQIIITQRWNNGYGNYTRLTESDFQPSLYNLNKYHVNRTNPRLYFLSFYEEFGIADDWNLNYATRIQMQVGVVDTFEMENKSALLADSVLTITKQVYDSFADEWQDEFKQEFFFTNTTTGSREINVSEKIILYPNPSSGTLNLRIENVKKLSRIDVVNSMGQTIKSENTGNFTGNYRYNRDLSYLSKGIYFVKILTDDRIVSKKLILR